jgi:putative ATP-dependent endonuclease of OLD family
MIDGMLIERIRIRNYRSCKDLTIYPQDMMALVGPNNAGKTNILSALNFLLGERWPSRQGLALSDFYNQEERRPLAIEVKFHPNDDDIATMQFAENPAQGDLRARYTYFNNSKLYTLNNDIREKGALVYLDAARSFDSHFSPSRWSLFGRIARELHDDFLQNAPEEVKQALTGHLQQAQEILKTERYRSFEAAIITAFNDQVRRHTHGVALQFRTFDPLNFYKSLQPLLVEYGEEKSPSEAGSGMRNLIVLALFRAYAKAFRGNAIFAIEEPEIFLHPHAQRSLAALFEELASAGNQVFFSTHSATFVNIARSERIVLVEMCDDEEDENCTQVREMDPNELLKERKKLHPSVEMTLNSAREKLRLLCGLEHAEAFFACSIREPHSLFRDGASRCPGVAPGRWSIRPVRRGGLQSHTRERGDGAPRAALRAAVDGREQTSTY